MFHLFNPIRSSARAERELTREDSVAATVTTYQCTATTVFVSSETVYATTTLAADALRRRRVNGICVPGVRKLLVDVPIGELDVLQGLLRGALETRRLRYSGRQRPIGRSLLLSRVLVAACGLSLRLRLARLWFRLRLLCRRCWIARYRRGESVAWAVSKVA